MITAWILPLLVLDPDAASAALEELRAEASEPRTPTRCAPFETAAQEALTARQVTGERTAPCVIAVTTQGKQPLAALAKRLEGQRVRLIFDAGYLVDNPYATASFDGEARLLRLPVSLLATGSLDEPTLQHELVHVAVWKKAHEDEKTLLAYLHGEPFKPNDLYLDEMRAYAEDLQRAAKDLEQACKKASPANWAGILASRLKGEPKQEGLAGCDETFDRLAAKLSFGKMHTDPALPALEALAKVSVSSRIEGDDPEVIVRGALGDDKIELHIASPIARQSHDNAPLIQSLLTQTKTHAAFWKKANESIDKLTHAKPKEVAKLLPKLTKALKPPMPAPKI